MALSIPASPLSSPEERLQKIRLIEELSLNAWPSFMTELYDGWLLRYSCNYTYRTNSVEQVGPSSLRAEEKVAYCEGIYRRFGTPCNFKISPLQDPSFDTFLSDRSYLIRHVTEVMTADFSLIPTPVVPETDAPVDAGSVITDDWIRGLFRLNGTTDPRLLEVVTGMYHAIPKDTIVCRIMKDGVMAASGLGILDREHIGIYAIYVDAAFRRRSYARAICTTLLKKGREQGARQAYLQVVKGNIPAKSLYLSLGFQDFYTYWFRSLPTDQISGSVPALHKIHGIY